MEETVRYTYRLRPGVQAVDALIAEWHRCRFLWNDAVAQMRAGGRVSPGALSKGLTAKRAEMDWLREGSQVAQQIATLAALTAEDADAALQKILSEERMAVMYIQPDGTAGEEPDDEEEMEE